MSRSKLKALGQSARNKKLYKTDEPHPEVLETFDSPFFSTQRPQVHIEVPEFTSLCPITGAPDFAKIVIDYIPDMKCVESKSAKLYFFGFRNFGSFHEAIVARICRDFVEVLEPKWIRVKGEFTPRGGIPFWPEVEWVKLPSPT